MKTLPVPQALLNKVPGWKSKTKVTSCELRVQIYELRVQIYELRVQNPRVTSSNP